MKKKNKEKRKEARFPLLFPFVSLASIVVAEHSRVASSLSLTRVTKTEVARHHKKIPENLPGDS